VLDADSGSRPRLIAAGAIRLRGEGLPERLKLLHEALQELIATHQPQVLAVETVFHGRSFDSVLKVGEARGVALLAAALHGLEVREYSPAEVKKTVTGNGRASKQQVQRMVARLLDLKTAPEPSDVADALAVAFCYAQRLWRRRLPPAEETPLRLALRELRGRRRRGAGQLSDGVRRLLERQGYTTGGVRRER
jgi:crossover junction endodeoxyribonuclease RuvC